MNKNRIKILSAMLLGMASVIPADAALPQINNAASATQPAFLTRGREMCGAGNFAGAVDALTEIATEQLPLDEGAMEEYVYLLADAYFHTADPRCPATLQKFLAVWPASARAVDARLLSGDFHFFAHDWSEALEEYRLVDIKSLNSTRRDLYTYRMGVCLVERGFHQEARPLFKSLASKKDYKIQAQYYDAYLDYVDGRDEEALRKFRKVAQASSSEDKAVVVDLHPDYYIAQLLFRKGDWEGCADLSRNLLKRGDVKDPEMENSTRRVLGISLYKLDDLRAARPYLEKYVAQAGDGATDDARYALGASLYESGDFDGAAEQFSRLLESRDAVSQGAYLYLGQIEAANGNPSAAAMNFEKAYRQNFDNKVAETALYNYVAACSKGGNIPFDSSAEMLERFIENYPQSAYAPAVERHLAWLCYQQGDYDAALTAIDRIVRPSAEDVRLKQSILYAAGAASLSSGNASRAASLLDRCVAIRNGNPEIACQANIWLGDARYSLGDYSDATRAYTAALNSGRADANRDILLYDLGYSLLMQNRFADAKKYFTLAAERQGLSASMRRDAEMRLADCKYYLSDFEGAAADFARLKSGGANADYALYRHAQLLGIRGDVNGKIRELTELERNYSASRWMPNVLNELADTYTAEGDHPHAAEAYGRMLDKYPVSPSSGKAMLGLASSLMASGDETGAVEAYRNLISSRGASDEARLADKELRRYYAANGGLDEYAQFLRSSTGYSIDASEMDDLAYEAAENAWLEGREGIAAIKRYIDKYPSGRHAAEAWQIYADELLDNGDKANALAAYRELEQRGGAEYAADAYAGIMRSADNAAVQLEYARKLRTAGGASAELLEEAEFIEAKADLGSSSAATRRGAEQTLASLARNPHGEAGARAAVTLAQHYLDSGNASRAIELMESLTSSGSGQQYWVARGFIVLADAYSASGKDYLAKEYLRSLRDNYPGDEDDIRRMISKRLN